MGTCGRFGRNVGFVSGLVVSSLVGAALGASRSASAGEAASDPAKEAAVRFTAIEAQVKAHITTKAVDALKQDVAEVSKEVSAAPDPKLRARFGTLLATILGGTTNDDVQKAAILAIGDTRDAALFPAIRRFLAQPDLDAEPPLCKVAIEAAGKLAAPDAVLPLMTLVDKSHVLGLSQAAMKAFELYGTQKGVRTKILKDLIATVEKDRPGTGNRWDSSSGNDPQKTARTRTNELTRQRWDALSGVLVATLNKMTGTQGATAEDWFKLYDTYKGGLDKLFVEPATK
jgi:HEAT repeat protein